MPWCTERKSQLTKTIDDGGSGTSIRIAPQGKGVSGAPDLCGGWVATRKTRVRNHTQQFRSSPNHQDSSRLTVQRAREQGYPVGSAPHPCSIVGALEQLLRVMYISHAWSA